jgi:hypothetical protein
MRRESVKLARLRRLYAKMRADYLIEHPWCAVGGCEATEIHHRRGRGAYLLAVETWLPVCHTHHVQITENPKWAKERGYSLSRLSVVTEDAAS